MYSERPAWKRLNNHALAKDERASLITAIFSDRNQVEIVGHLSGDEAQSFIDAIDTVGPRTISRSNEKVIDRNSNPHIFSIRRWTPSHQRSEGSACAISTGFVVNKPYFRDRW